jgi:MraZ protein
MLLGEYEYKIDNKGRLPLPTKFRQEFREGIVLTRGFENCIVAWRSSDFEKIAGSYSSQTLGKSKMRRLARFTFGNAFDLQLDAQGRVALPSALRQYAGITDAAIIVGANNCIELWNPQKWQEEQKEAESQAWQIQESLEDSQ